MWREVTYARSKEPPRRGWVREDKLEIVRDPLFVENMAVHDHQLNYEEAVRFPRKQSENMIEVGKVTAKSGLHLRKGPDAHSEIKATLPFGTVVKIESRYKKWLLVTYNFKSGYLYEDYVEVSKAPVPDLDPPGEPPYTLPMGARVLVLLVLALMAIWFIAAWVW